MTEKKHDDLELDKYDYEFHKEYKSTGWARIQEKIGNFLCFCAGADTQLLARCPQSERVKEQGIGGVVFATATLAFFSGSYAFYTVFSPKPGFMAGAVQEVSLVAEWSAMFGAVLFGLVWSLVIFNLDRFIVASGGHGDGTDKITLGEFGRAIPRIIMAIVIGLVLSKPLEIRIMKTEIEAQLREDQDAALKRLDAATQARFDKIESELKEQRAKIESNGGEIVVQSKKYSDAWQERQKEEGDECAGKGESSGMPGFGPRCKAARVRTVEAKQMLEQYNAEHKEEIQDIKRRQDAIQQEINALAKKREDEKNYDNKKAVAKVDGLIMRIQIAHKIAPTASYMLTALLMVLEIAPIFFKMMLTLGPYDYFNENQKRIALAMRGIHPRDELAQTSGHAVHLHDMKYEQAERARKHEVGKLEIEQELTVVAQEKFRLITGADIESNPNKYMNMDKPAA